MVKMSQTIGVLNSCRADCVMVLQRIECAIVEKYPINIVYDSVQRFVSIKFVPPDLRENRALHGALQSSFLPLSALVCLIFTDWTDHGFLASPAVLRALAPRNHPSLSASILTQEILKGWAKSRARK